MNIEIPTDEDGELLCVICQEKIGYVNHDGDRESPVQLDCHHVFGNICLDSWLSKKSRCPICRERVEGYNTASSSEGSDSGESMEGDSGGESDDEDSDMESDVEVVIDVSSDSDMSGLDSGDENDGDQGAGEDTDSDMAVSEVEEGMDQDTDSDRARSGVEDQDSQSGASQATHITISSDGIDAGSDMSVEDVDGHEQMTEDGEEQSDADAEQQSYRRRHGPITPQDLMTRITSHAAVGSLMRGIVAGRIDLGSILNQTHRPVYESISEDDGDSD